jgi:hypothetical protein
MIIEKCCTKKGRDVKLPHIKRLFKPFRVIEGNSGDFSFHVRVQNTLDIYSEYQFS